MFHFILIALFMFAFQITTLHTKHQLSEDADHCHVCQASKHLDGSHHHSPIDLIMDTPVLEIREIEEKVMIKERYMINLPQFRRGIPGITRKAIKRRIT